MTSLSFAEIAKCKMSHEEATDSKQLIHYMILVFSCLFNCLKTGSQFL